MLPLHVLLVLATLVTSVPVVFGIKKFQTATRPPVPPPPPPQIVFQSEMIAPSQIQQGYNPSLSLGNSDFNVGYRPQQQPRPQYQPQRPSRPTSRPRPRPSRPQRPQRPFSSVISRPPVPIPPKPQVPVGSYMTSSLGNEQYTYITYQKPQG